MAMAQVATICCAPADIGHGPRAEATASLGLMAHCEEPILVLFKTTAPAHCDGQAGVRSRGWR